MSRRSKGSKHTKITKYLALIILIAWIALIWIHSMMPGDVSSNESNAVVDFINRIISFTGLSVTSFMVRKSAHFTEYAILGLLLGINFKKSFPVAMAMFAGLLAALIDESIQYFTPGRACQVRDVWIDFAGVVCGLIILYLVRHFRKSR